MEAIYSANFVENYLDAVENLPDDVQRLMSRIRDIDVQYRTHLKDVEFYYEQWSNCPTSELEGGGAASKRGRAMARIQQNLIAAQEFGDEKLQITAQLQDLIDVKTRQLDHDFKNLDYGRDDMVHEMHAKEQMFLTSPNVNSGGMGHLIGGLVNNNYNSHLYVQMPNANSGISGLNSSEHLRLMSGMGGLPHQNGNGGGMNSNGGGYNDHRTSSTSKRARRTRTETGNGMDIGSSDSNLAGDLTLKMTSGNNGGNAGNSSMSAGGNPGSSGNGSNNNNGSGKKGAGVAGNSGKKKKRKSRLQGMGGSGSSSGGGQHQAGSSRDQNRDDTPPPDDTIDPDEPTYCLCDQISFGEMILCDNDLCPIEWFHFSCVSLASKPKGKWYCPNCRGDRPNVMKPKAQFLKELERYNKEKEEKT